MKIIPTGLTQKISRQILEMKKDSPKILFVVGVVGVVGTTILACRATLKLEKTLEVFKEDVDKVKVLSDDSTHNESDNKKFYNKEMAKVYVKGTVKIVKLYGPSVLLGVASIGALTTSHVTLTRRNTSLMAAYSAVSASFDAYRQRVREELGDEKELDIHHAARIEKLAVDGKTQALRVADPNKWSPYARFFEESNRNWNKNAEFNRLFIQAQQNYLNHLLQARGHVFLNEVYDALGIERSSAGQVVGWVMGQGGDNFIDFGMFEAHSSHFINGWERNVILDFNVDGVIYDKL